MIDMREAALESFRDLALLYFSGGPWDLDKRERWRSLQIPIHAYGTRLNVPPLLDGFVEDATTKGLCDLGRSIL